MNLTTISFSSFRIAFLLLVLGMILSPGGSQTSGTRPAGEALEKSRQLSVEGQFVEAYAMAREAQRLAAAAGAPLLLADAMLEQGKYLARNGFSEEATAVLDSLLAMEASLGSQHPTLLVARAERADVAYLSGQMEEHLARYQSLAADCERLPATADSLRGVLFQWVGEAFAIHDSLETALRYVGRSLEHVQRALPPDHLQLAYSHNSLAVIHNHRGEPEAAMFHLEQALRIFQQRLRPDHSHLIQVRSNLASLYLNDGLMWEAIRVLEENLPLLENVSQRAQYSSLYKYATARNMVGDHETALAYLDQTEALILARPGLDPEAPGNIAYLRAAACQYLGENEAALKHIDAGIRSLTDLHGKNFSPLLTDFLRRGTVLTNMKRYPEAIAALEEALRLAHRQQPLHAMRTGWVWESLGKIYLRQAHFHQALGCFRQAAALFSQPNAQWNLCDTYSHMAQAWRSLGSPDSNQYYLEKAWQFALPELPYQQNPGDQILAYWHRTSLPTLLREQAESLHDRAMQAGAGGCEEAQAAAACLKACVALADSQAFYFDMPGSRRASHQARTEPLALLAAWEQDFSSLAPCYSSQAEAIFLLAEAGKASALRAHLRGQQVVAGVPDSVLEQESRIRQRLAILAHPAPGDTSQTDPAAFTRAQQAYRSLIRRIEARYPAYYRLKYAGETFALSSLQQRLHPGQVLYSYLSSGDSLLAFRAQRGQFEMFSVPASSLADLRLWLDFVSRPPGNEVKNEAVTLALHGHRPLMALLGTLPSDVTELIILPDGWLHRLPFESLLLSVPSGPDFRQWQFLGRKIAVSYLQAAELWWQSVQDKEEWSRPDYVGFAPSFQAAVVGTERGQLLPLAFNEEEVKRAAGQMGGRALMGKDASEASFKDISRPAVLHLATHAIAEENQPMLSRLYLSPDSSDDGILYAHELYAIRLESPLAVLSACETAAGREEEGEGMNSLARAFQYAGCDQLLTTRWPADDPSTAELIPGFFGEIKDGARCSEALRVARNHFLDQSDFVHGHPYYWAHLMLIGNGEPIEQGWEWWWLAVGLGGILVGWWGVRSWISQASGAG